MKWSYAKHTWQPRLTVSRALISLSRCTRSKFMRNTLADTLPKSGTKLGVTPGGVPSRRTFISSWVALRKQLLKKSPDIMTKRIWPWPRVIIRQWTVRKESPSCGRIVGVCWKTTPSFCMPARRKSSCVPVMGRRSRRKAWNGKRLTNQVTWTMPPVLWSPEKKEISWWRSFWNNNRCVIFKNSYTHIFIYSYSPGASSRKCFE